MSEHKIITFLDTIGRTIIGEEVVEKSNEEVLTVKNPALIHIIPNPQSGQIQLQILPLFFREFLADKDEGTYWKYNRKNITESEPITYDFKLPAQYRQIFSSVPLVIPTPQKPTGEAPVIKLFEE